MNPIRDNQKKPSWIIVENDDEQAKYIIKKIKQYRKRNVSLSEIAILYRSNYHSLRLQKELKVNGILYEIRSGLTFFELAHIKDLITHFRILFNPKDELSWYRVFSIIPGLGKVNAKKIYEEIRHLVKPFIELSTHHFFNNFKKKIKISTKVQNNFVNYFKKLKEFTSNTSPLLVYDSIIDLIINHLKKCYDNYDERIEDVYSLRELVAEYHSIKDFLDELNLSASETSNKVKCSTTDTDKKNLLVLSTIHKAKGLEWKVVFLISLSEPLFPSKRNIGNSDLIEEERRIFYVGVTRAKDDLYLISPQFFNSERTYKTLTPSRFITELDDSLYELMDFSLQKQVEQSPCKHKLTTEKFIPKFLSADKLLKDKDY